MKAEWILFEDKSIIAVNKPAGLPVHPDKTGDSSLMEQVAAHTNTSVHLLHRVDRPVSGVVLFAKRPKATKSLSEQFQRRTVWKTYLAIVKNKPEAEKDKLVDFLTKDNKRHKAILSDEEVKNSQKAVLNYEYVASSDHYHLLKIGLETGRYHQIRAQLAAIGCPIKGDVKYGFKRGNKDRSINLHAWKINFRHPISKEIIEIEAPLPDEPIWKFYENVLS